MNNTANDAVARTHFKQEIRAWESSTWLLQDNYNHSLPCQRIYWIRKVLIERGFCCIFVAICNASGRHSQNQLNTIYFYLIRIVHWLLGMLKDVISFSQTFLFISGWIVGEATAAACCNRKSQMCYYVLLRIRIHSLKPDPHHIQTNSLIGGSTAAQCTSQQQ